MPRQVKDINIMTDFLRGVMSRADHHAPSVEEVALAISGGVLWRKDDEPLEVFEREGQMKNVLWFKVNKKRYTLSYAHKTDKIELREKTTQGKVIDSFSNATTLHQIYECFSKLGN